mgnify:CR=1 FL=1
MSLVILAIIGALVSLWAAFRKGLAGLPLILGVWFLYASGLLLYFWFPPTPPQIALVFFLAGISITVIIWGIYNVWLNLCFAKKLKPIKKPLGKVGGMELFIALDAKPNYGIMYGLIPWDDQGADILYNFLNNEIWEKGLKLTHFDAEHAEIGGMHCAFILGIIRPKTIIDRILY